MSDINLKRFVDIDIKSNVARAVSGTRDVLTLFTADGTEGTVNLVKSLTEAETLYGSHETTLAYLRIFFNNGGAKCNVIEGVDYDDITKDILTSLSNERILIAYAGETANLTAVYTKLKGLADSLNSDTSIYGINEKIIIARTNVATDSSMTKNFAVKYSNILGAEMTIAAYLTQVNVYKVGTVNDYSFTKESITPEAISDSTYEDISLKNLNVAVELSGTTRNLGGNLKDGAELTNTFTKIILHQTLTERLINLLVQKIKNSSGTSQIYSVLSQELEVYKSAGYLTTDKVWKADDLDIEYNGETYTVIEKGTPLINGYVIKVLPISSLTDADKAAHKCPPVYIVIADQYGIRQITISGEVI